MAEDLMSGNTGKHHIQTKKFLEEARILIELGNLVETFAQGHIKLCVPLPCNNEVDICNKIQRHHKKRNKETNEEQAFVSWPMSEARRQATRRTRPAAGSTRAASYARKNIESKPCTFNFKDLSKDKLLCLKAGVQKDIKLINKEATKYSRKRQDLSPSSKKAEKISTELKESIIKKQILASSLDMAKFMQHYLIKDLSEDKSVHNPSIVLLPKTDLTKRNHNTWKSCGSLWDSFSFNNVENQKTKKRDTGNGVSKREVSKPLDTQPSLQLKMNLRMKPNSNTMNLQIKSRQGTKKAAKNNPDVSCPLNCELSSHQELINRLKAINKLSTNFSTSVLSDRSATTPSAQISNDQDLPFMKPYAKTQAVYNVYDVTQYQQPGKMRGIRSHISFNLDIGRGPKSTQQRTYASEGYPLSAPPSGRLADKRQVRYNTQVNFDSGSTSMQQSLSLGRRSPQSESPYESDGYSRYERAPYECDTCRQNNLFQRTRQRIVDRVGDGDSPSIFSPINYFKNCYARITCKKETHRKSVGNCTCSPFIETQQFSVQEGNVNPSCTFFERFFGSLFFENKCAVCTEKACGTNYQKLKPYECAPDTCVEKKPSIFACFKNLCPKSLCKKKEVEPKLKKEKERKEKKQKQKKALVKAKKERVKKKEKKERVKRKGTSSTSFVTSIFMNPEDDDDKEMLLSDEGQKTVKKGKKVDDIEETRRRKCTITSRGYRKLTRRIRERYYRNKRMAEEQKGRYACDFYLMSLRTRPCLWVYYLCPVCYPYTLQMLNVWRQLSDLMLFFVAIIVWSPCIICAECLKILACNLSM